MCVGGPSFLGGASGLGGGRWGWGSPPMRDAGPGGRGPRPREPACPHTGPPRVYAAARGGRGRARGHLGLKGQPRRRPAACPGRRARLVRTPRSPHVQNGTVTLPPPRGGFADEMGPCLFAALWLALPLGTPHPELPAPERPPFLFPLPPGPPPSSDTWGDSAFETDSWPREDGVRSHRAPGPGLAGSGFTFWAVIHSE